MLRPSVFAPLRSLSGYTSGTVNLPSPAPDRPPLPGLRLPLPSRGVAPGAVLAVLVHASVLAALVIRGREPAGGRPGPAAPDAVNFFVLSRGTPTSVDVALTLHVPLPDLSGLRRIAIALPPLDLPRPSLPLPVMPLSGGTGGAEGARAGGGRATEAVTFFTPRRGRRFFRRWRRCPAQWPAAPCGCRSGWRPTDASRAWQWTPHRRRGVQPGVPAAHDGIPVLPGAHAGRTDPGRRRHRPPAHRQLTRPPLGRAPRSHKALCSLLSSWASRSSPWSSPGVCGATCCGRTPAPPTCVRSPTRSRRAPKRSCGGSTARSAS